MPEAAAVPVWHPSVKKSSLKRFASAVKFIIELRANHSSLPRQLMPIIHHSQPHTQTHITSDYPVGLGAQKQRRQRREGDDDDDEQLFPAENSDERNRIDMPSK